MRVLAYAQSGYSAELAQAFVCGAKRHGAAAEVRDAATFERPEACDVIWLYGLIPLQGIFDAYRGRALRVTGDLGYWRERACELPIDKRPVRIAIEAQQPDRHLQRRVHGPERFAALALNVQPVRERGEDILVTGSDAEQAQFYGSAYGEWEGETCVRLLHITARPLVLREKPGSPPIGIRHVGHCIEPDAARAIRRAWAVVCRSGNIGADCLLHGVPVFAEAGPGAVYYRAPIEQIDAAQPLDAYKRISALSDLAYWQWTMEECAAGELWSHLLTEGVLCR